MRTSRTLVGAALSSGLLAGSLLVSPATAAPSQQSATGHSGDNAEYLVLLERGADRATALEAIRDAGGSVVKENRALGAVTVRSSDAQFALDVSRSSAIVGAARDQAIGHAPKGRDRQQKIEREQTADLRDGRDVTASGRRTASRAASTAGMDPLDENLWGLRMVRSDLARERNAGDRRVLVGVLDTGIDGRHPDLAPNFNAKLSRNFVVDMPEVDGPCEFRGCKDPASWDDHSHGTHVAGTIAAAANDFGLSGVAPKVSLVNIRGAQDSGYFFVGPVTEALTYAGDAGLDVVNMSFYVDPWLYNCTANPADSPEAQAEQRTIIEAMDRALTYAHRKGVTLVGALGNNHEDLGKPRTDTSSPDFGDTAPYPRPIDNSSCWDLPAEGAHVIGVSALGPSSTKSDYSNYGLEQISVSAPGGYFRDYDGTDRYRTVQNMILSSVPVNVVQAEGLVDENGDLTPDGEAAGIIKECPDGATHYSECGYYNWYQGTSMASPHAAGVAALIVSAHGKKQRNGFGLAPDEVERILYASAQKRPCPEPPLVSYTNVGRSAEFDALCEGDREFNGFYGHGIVDAMAAVTYRR